MAKFSPVFNDQTFDANGNPASGYKLFTYAAGSSTKQTAYTDSAGSVPQSNPIVLNASGYPKDGPIWLTAGQTYKFVLASSTDTDPPTSPLKTIDNVSGVNDSSTTNTQWVSTGVTPSYVSGTSFTMPGDQTAEFHVGRRMQCTVTAGTVYGTITAAVYGALTTITATIDSGALDSGLSNVNLGILRADNLAIPGFVTGAYGCRGLVGNVNAGTPLTKFDISANAVTLRNASGATMTRYSTGTLTCDLGLAGSAANGRDQAAAFSANSWVYLYFIWNGTTLATIASTSSSAPTLPAGYTHYAFATALRWNAASNIIPAYARGCSVFYDLAAGGVNRVLTAGQATVMTTVSLSGFVPPITQKAKVNFAHSVTHNTTGIDFSVAYRPTGSTNAGIAVTTCVITAANIANTATNTSEVSTNSSQQIDYKINAVPSGSGGAYIDVLGYDVPNGDA